MAWFPHRSIGALVVVATLLIGACASAPYDLEVATGEPIATTAPVGVPVVPTPTPLGIPAVLVPGPDAADDDQSEGSTPGERMARVVESSAAPVEPTALPEPTEPPQPTEPPAVPATSVPEPTAAPAPTATNVPAPTATPVPSTPVPATPVPEASAPVDRSITATGYRPLGQAASISLTLPVEQIELIGFHEAGHPGSTAINAAGTGVTMVTLDSRGRGTHERSAADIVVPPGQVVLSPVTGTVIAANDYVLYCKHDDALVYIEPDGLPGWVVRVFHVEGALPAVGARVVAGVTKIADSARTLPFESQVDELTAEPSWPHLHIEVVDTSVPDTRPPGPGCP